MIEFDETIRALYFVSGRGQDWMAGVNEEPDGTVTFTYRFRYDHADSSPDEANSDKDTRNWYQVKTTKYPLPFVIDCVERTYVELLAMGYSPKDAPRYKRVRGTMPFQEFMAEFQRQPFVRVRETVTFNNGDAP